MAMDGSVSFGFVLTVRGVHVVPLDDWSRTPDPALRKAMRGWPAASTAIEGSTSRGAPSCASRAPTSRSELVAYSMEVVSGDVGERLEREVGVAGRVEGDRGVGVLGGRASSRRSGSRPSRRRRSWRRRCGSCRAASTPNATRSDPLAARAMAWVPVRPRPRASSASSRPACPSRARPTARARLPVGDGRGPVGRDREPDAAVGRRRRHPLHRPAAARVRAVPERPAPSRSARPRHGGDPPHRRRTPGRPTSTIGSRPGRAQPPPALVA